MQDENNKLLEKFSKIIKDLTFHAHEGSTCRHSAAQFLEQVEFENE